METAIGDPYALLRLIEDYNGGATYEGPTHRAVFDIRTGEAPCVPDCEGCRSGQKPPNRNKNKEYCWLKPLHVASANGHLKVVEFLLGHPGIKIPRYYDTRPLTPLMLAAKNGHAEVVRALTNHPEVDVNENTSGATALELAIKAGLVINRNRFLAETEIASFEKPKFGQNSIIQPKKNNFSRNTVGLFWPNIFS